MAPGTRSRSQSSSSKNDELLDENRISNLVVLKLGKKVATTKYGFEVGDDRFEAKGAEFQEKINSKGDTVMALNEYWTDDIGVFTNDNIDSKGKGKAAYVESESEGDDKQEKNTQERELENERESEESEEQGDKESGQESGRQSEEDDAQNQNRSPTRRDVHKDGTPSKTPTKVAFADTLTSIFPMTSARKQREQRLAEERRQEGQSRPSSPNPPNSNRRSRDNSFSRDRSPSRDNTPREKSRSRDEGPSTNNTPRGKSRSRDEGQSTNNTPRGKSQSRGNTPSDNTRGENNRSREEGQSTNSTPRGKSRSRDEGQSTNNTPRGKSQSRGNTPSDNTRGENNRSREEGQSTNSTPRGKSRSRDEGQSTNNTPRDNTSSRKNNSSQSTANSQGIPLASSKQPHDKVSIQEHDDTWTDMTIRGCMKRGNGTLMLLNAPSKNPEHPEGLRGFLKASRQHKTKVATFLEHNKGQMIKYGSIEKLENANGKDIRIWAIYDTDQDPSQTVVTDANGNQHEILSCFREPWTIVDIGILNEKPELYKRSDILPFIGDNDLDAYRRAVMQPIPVHAKPLKEQKRTRNFGLAAQYSKSGQASQPTTERAESQRAESQGAGSQRAGSRAGPQRAGSQGAASQGAEPQGAGSQRAASQGGAGSQRSESQRARSQGAESQGAESQNPDSGYGSPNRHAERKGRDEIEICTICNNERGTNVATVHPCGHSFDYDCLMEFAGSDYDCHTCLRPVNLGVYVESNGLATPFRIPDVPYV
ncbi:hypothetical protein V501_00535 [Pseudogymnoascus sp. VKM F-4519 (FW-2642)]|nr:hypothetical protein V501_00535 [Pseudogymnoascus sp. VKM F-4519 (FW-2642)]